MPRTDTASRVIAAPLAQVYAALVDSEAVEAWLSPRGMTGSFERFDPRPGGSYRLSSGAAVRKLVRRGEVAEGVKPVAAFVPGAVPESVGDPVAVASAGMPNAPADTILIG